MTTIIHDKSIFSERPAKGVVGTYCLGTADGESAFAPEIGVKVKSLFVTGSDRKTRETVLRSVLVGIASAYGAGEAEVAIAEREGIVDSLVAFGRVSIVKDHLTCADGKTVAELVDAAYDETFRRMDILRRAGASDIDDYNSRGLGTMGKYFLVDFRGGNGFRYESAFCRLFERRSLHRRRQARRRRINLFRRRQRGCAPQSDRIYRRRARSLRGLSQRERNKRIRKA